MSDIHFDIDLKFGEEGERWLTMLADEKKMEVKRDRLWKETGNIAFEYAYKGRHSGIAVTRAEFFAVIITDNGHNHGVMVFPTEQLKRNLRLGLRLGKFTKVNGGDGGNSAMILVPLAAVHTLFAP